MKRSKKTLTYHGRKGHPVIHHTKTKKSYIMVRKRGGGTKRLFLKRGRVPAKYRKPVKHRK